MGFLRSRVVRLQSPVLHAGIVALALCVLRLLRHLGCDAVAISTFLGHVDTVTCSSRYVICRTDASARASVDPFRVSLSETSQLESLLK